MGILEPMDFLYAAILGAIQGLTEFLPISSTAHLILTERLFGLDPDDFGLGFDAAIQLGTTVAVIYFFRADLWQLIGGWRRPEQQKLLALLVIATIPALVAGALLLPYVEGPLRDPAVIAAALLIGGGFFLAVERTAKARKRPDQMTKRDALIIGLAQCLALIPGVSRSGSTIVPAMWLGLKREDAARFTFLLSIPVIAIAGLKKTYDVAQGGAGGRLDLIAVGLVVAMIVGYFSIKYLLRFLAGHRLDVFAWYRFALAFVIIVILMA